MTILFCVLSQSPSAVPTPITLPPVVATSEPTTSPSEIPISPSVSPAALPTSAPTVTHCGPIRLITPQQTFECTVIEGDLIVEESYYGVEVGPNQFPNLREIEGKLDLEDNVAVQVVDLPKVASIGDRLSVLGSISLRELLFPALTFAGYIRIGWWDTHDLHDNPVLERVDFQNLQTVNFWFIFVRNGLVEVLDLPNLTFLRGVSTSGFRASENDELRIVNCPNLAGHILGITEFNDNPKLTTINFPLVSSVQFHLYIHGNSVLETGGVNFGSLTEIGGRFVPDRFCQEGCVSCYENAPGMVCAVGANLPASAPYPVYNNKEGSSESGTCPNVQDPCPTESVDPFQF